MLEYAGPAAVTFNGRPMIQTCDIRIQRVSNAQKIKTLAGGLVGRTKGAPEYNISGKNAVPAAGYEVDINNLIETQEICQIGVVKAGQEEIFEGWFESSDTNSEVDQPIYNDWTFHGSKLTQHAI